MAATQTGAKTPLLNLDLIEGYTVQIDGTTYRLHSLDSLPIAALRKVERLHERFQALWNIPAPTTAEEQALSGVCDEVCRLVLDAPSDVHERLTDVQRMTVYRVFQKLPAATLPLLQQQQTTAERPTGANASRGSAASTAATRSAGTKRSRPGSSARRS